LTHKYDKYSRSPFSYGSLGKDWVKVVCCPKKKSPTRLSYELYLKSNFPDRY